jgi:long-chain acyl-CoA synthetase
MSNLWDAQTAVPPNPTDIPGETVPAVFWNACERRCERVFLREKKLGLWRSWTWRQVGEAVRETAVGLAAMGLQPGEWLMADLAILSAGGVTNGVYPTDSAEQLHYLCLDSLTRLLFVEDEEQLDKALAVRASLPLLRHIVVFDMAGLQHFDDPMVIGLEELRTRGRAHDAAHPALFEQRACSRQPGDLAILVYTSGTTGKPKGAMHSHAGLVYSMRQVVVGLPQDEQDERMCFLPLCHIAERMVGAYASLYAGAVLNFVENPETVAENVREIAPTIFFAVPRVWEKFYSSVVIAIQEASPLQQVVYRWALGVGGQVVDRVLAREAVGPGLRLRFLLARGLVLNNVRKLIGIHRCRALLTGAAPISPALIRWYLSLGVPMLEGWAQTESCALGTISRADAMRPGTIGVAADGVELKLDPATGELLLRGRNVFMGYLNQPEKTAETIDADGWLHTGDVGTADGDGYFRITDRMKDIIITAGGKNITPSELENELKFSPYITDAVVIGDRRAYLTVLIMIDQDNVEKFAQDHEVPFSNYASLTRAREVQELIGAELARVNKKFARVEQIKQFRLLETQLGAEDEELTPTMKLKRSFVQKKYAELIESMYRTGG